MNKKYFISAVIALSIALLPYLLLAFFSVPSADDFLQAHYSLEYGVFGYTKWRYLTWNGRYAADFLVALYNNIGHLFLKNFIINFYYISSLLLILLYALSGFVFVIILFGNKHLKVGLIFSLIALIYNLGNSEVRSTFFWFSGGIAYTLANSFFIILVALITRFFCIYPRKKVLLMSLFLVPIINGLSETSMVTCTTFVLSFLLLETLFLPNFRTRLILEKLALSVFVIVSALVLYIAPGNANRILSDGQSEINFIEVISKTTVFTSIKAFHLINPFWFALILITILLSQRFFEVELKNIFKDKKFFLVVLTSLILAFYASYFVRFYSNGSSLPLRADSTSYTVFFLITAFTGFFIGSKFDWSKLFIKRMWDNSFLMLVTLFCCFSFASNYSFYAIAHDFKLLKSHYNYYQKLYPTLIQANPGSEIVLPPEPRVKILRWKCYLVDNNNYWVNQAVADYFDLKSVVVQGSGGTDPDTPGTGECGG